MLLALIAFLAGVFRYRFWGYWKWALLLPAWLLIASLLFSGGGTLENPQGDGLITHHIRIATNDGVEMAGFAAVVMVLSWGPAIYFCHKMYRAVKSCPNPCDEAKSTPWMRKGFEATMLLCVFFLYGFWAYADMLNGHRLRIAPSRPLDAIADAVTIAALEAAVREINADSPKKIDPITTLVGASMEGRTLIYYYELSSLKVTKEQFKAFFVKKIAPNACSNKDMRSAMDEHGVTYRYNYKFLDSSLYMAFDISSSSCRTLGE